MPKTEKKSTTPAVKNRSAAIRKSHQNQAAVEDERDVAAGIVTPQAVTLDTRRAPDAMKALTVRQQADKLQIVDRRTSEEGKEFVRGCKQLKRGIEDHWTKITRPVDDLKKTLLRQKSEDLQPVEDAIAIVSRRVLDYDNAEIERARRADQDRRDKAEREAREQRERDLAAAEDKALALEAASENLSPRELWFVTQVVEQELEVSNPNTMVMRSLLAIAKQGGYVKDTDTQVARLLRSAKVIEAIRSARESKALREQARALREQPIDIAPVAPVESQVGKASGVSTRTYYSMEVIDVAKLREAVLNGDAPSQALMPDENYLNAQARAMKDAAIFEKTFPGVRLVKRQDLAG